MPRISKNDQINLWGKAGDSGALDPQRNDLFYVDFSQAVHGLAATPYASGWAKWIDLNALTINILPQYVRSVTLPESRTKPEVVRRSSVPYNMPSWDDPLDPVKINFLVDTHSNKAPVVLKFLDAWLSLIRAGRGERKTGYSGSPVLCDPTTYKVECRFGITIWMLRGIPGESANDLAFYAAAEAADLAAAQATVVQRNIKRVQGLMQTGLSGMQVQQLQQAFPTLTEPLPTSQPFNPSLNSDMQMHTYLRLNNAWLGGYKVSDFNHAESALSTIEATFYPESIDTSYEK